ncbi:MAG: YlxM family DNA-binding protein [Oscillospiraceae bacterium]|nr:YlxM family DNA-binding protein [Oscillospiraceae bacterium]MBR5261554.1 YlxM family DNA-binding protein [Oscillospiraceae bacterium]
MDTVMKTMLFDFFGELLTEKQREYFDLHYNEDLSLYEIAEQNGVSRQAVWDIIRRGEQTLIDTEEKTGLVAKAIRRRDTLEEIEKALTQITASSDPAAAKAAEAALSKLREVQD